MDLKSLLVLIMACTKVSLVSFCVLAPNTGHAQDRAMPLTMFDRDAGAWATIKVGYQTNGSPFEKRLSASVQYEYRFREAWSISLSIQLWKTRRFTWDGMKTTEWYMNSGSMMVAFKLRLPFRSWTPFAAAGFGSGMAQAIILFHYSAGTEVSLSQQLHLVFEIQRTTVQEDSFFLQTGIAFKL